MSDLVSHGYLLHDKHRIDAAPIKDVKTWVEHKRKLLKKSRNPNGSFSQKGKTPYVDVWLSLDTARPHKTATNAMTTNPMANQAKGPRTRPGHKDNRVAVEPEHTVDRSDSSVIKESHPEFKLLAALQNTSLGKF